MTKSSHEYLHKTAQVTTYLPRHKGSTALSVTAGATAISALAVAGVIAFHEAGHFLAAKCQGMKVQSFNIGYGPKLLSFNDSANTEFALRIIPLGWYRSIFTINKSDTDNKI